MARTARDKAQFSTYLIEQTCQATIFETAMTRCAFIDALDQAIRQYNCLIIACELTACSYRLIVYDNGGDISRIMRSINISFSMTTAQRAQFKRRFKSTRLADSQAIRRHLAQFKPLDVAMRQSLIAANERVNSSDFRQRLFDCHDQFCQFIKARGHLLPCLESNCHRSAAPIVKYRNRAAAIAFLESELTAKRCTPADLKGDKKLRNHYILHLRKHSALTLRQLGELFGIGESAVSKIIKRANWRQP